MRYSSLFPKWCSSQRTNTTLSASELLSALLGKMGVDSQEESKLFRLWNSWESVMGDELAEMAFPLGRRRSVLLVGGEDSLVLQELAFRKDEIMERANAFIGTPLFDKVELSLAMGRPDLTKVSFSMPSSL